MKWSCASGLLALLLLACSGGTSNQAPSKTAKPALTVEVITPQQRDLPLTVRANGNVQPWQEATIGAEIGGLQVTQVLVNVGDWVRRGQILATFSDATVQADLNRQQAIIRETEATLAQARTEAERARLLDETGAISRQEILQYQTQAQTAAARLEAARAQLRQLQVTANNTRVRAPDDGIIAVRTATVGSVPQTGGEMFRLIRDGRLEWQAEVPSVQLGRVRAGVGAEVESPAGEMVRGKVRQIAPVVDPNTRNGIVYVDLYPGSNLKAGMFASGKLLLGMAPALTLPASSVISRDGNHYVMLVGTDSRVRETKVVVTQQLPDAMVVQGLAPEAQVVKSGAGFLINGDLVRVASPAALTAAPAAPYGYKP